MAETCTLPAPDQDGAIFCTLEAATSALGADAMGRLLDAALERCWGWERQRDGSWGAICDWSWDELCDRAPDARQACADACEGPEEGTALAARAFLLLAERLADEGWFLEASFDIEQEAARAFQEEVAGALREATGAEEVQWADEGQAWREPLWERGCLVDPGAERLYEATDIALLAFVALSPAERGALRLAFADDPDDVYVEDGPVDAARLAETVRALGTAWLAEAEPYDWQEEPALAIVLPCPEAMAVLGDPEAEVPLTGAVACLADPDRTHLYDRLFTDGLDELCDCGPADPAVPGLDRRVWHLAIATAEPEWSNWAERCRRHGQGPVGPERRAAARALVQALEAAPTVARAAAALYLARRYEAEGLAGALPDALAALAAGAPVADVLAAL